MTLKNKRSSGTEPWRWTLYVGLTMFVFGHAFTILGVLKIGEENAKAGRFMAGGLMVAGSGIVFVVASLNRRLEKLLDDDRDASKGSH